MAPHKSQNPDEQESKEPCGRFIELTISGSVYTSLIAVNGLDLSQDIAASKKSLNNQLARSSNSSLKVNLDLASNRAKPKLPSKPSSHQDSAQDLRYIGGWIQQDSPKNESNAETAPRN